MASLIIKQMLLGLALLCLATSAFALPMRIRTSSPLPLPEAEDDRSSLVWDDDAFDLDGDSWLSESPSPSRSTWDTRGHSPSVDDVDDNVIDDDIDNENIDDDEDDDDEQDGGRGSEFLFLPEGKRTDDVVGEDAEDDVEVKVRHAGRLPHILADDDENAVSQFEMHRPIDVTADVDDMLEHDEITLGHDENMLGRSKDVMERDTSDDDDEEESYDLASYPEIDDDKDVDDSEDDDDDVFGKPGPEDSENMFEDHVFLF